MNKTTRPNAAEESQNEKPGLVDKWWGKVVGGVLLAGVAVLMYQELAEIEASGGSTETDGVIGRVYELGGIWGGVGFFIVLSVACILWGLNQLRTGRE